MITPHLRIAAATVTLAALFAVTISGQTADAVQSQPSRIPFLTALPSRFVIPADDPRQPQFCRTPRAALHCPPMLVYGTAGGGLPTIDPAFKTYLPNVRVSLVIQQIENQVVSGGGVGPESAPQVSFTTIGSAANLQAGGPYPVELPGPGAFVTNPLLVYDALVFGACGSFSSFPIDHTAALKIGPVDQAGFHGVDNATLHSTGFYNVSYTAHATDMIGQASDFHFSGKVSVTCSAADSL